MFKKIKKGIDNMSKTAMSIIEGMEKGIKSLADPKVRRIVGCILAGTAAGLIVSSYI